MPRRSALIAVADEDAAEGGVATLDRALSLLSVFTPATPTPTLAELAAQTRIYKSTVLRMLASLQHARLVTRRADGRYELGAEVARLHRVYLSSFSLEAAVLPALRGLVESTRESAAFYVRQGEQRLCLYRVDSPRPVRDHLKAGDLLPLDRGAAGRVLLAFGGARGALYSQVRRAQVLTLAGHRDPEIAGVSAPVFGAEGQLVGALTVTMPSERADPRFEQPVLAAARALTRALGGDFPDPES